MISMEIHVAMHTRTVHATALWWFASQLVPGIFKHEDLSEFGVVSTCAIQKVCEQIMLVAGVRKIYRRRLVKPLCTTSNLIGANEGT